MNQKSNYNKFLLIWSGELISSIGSGLTSFGLGVYVFQKTGSAANMALVTLMAFLPALLLSAPAGVLADRYDRRLLREGSDINAFATAYREAGLPDNGPTITYSLIRMMNALSDGMMILIILLISVVALFISILCIRYIILTQLEKDKRRIGMMKAVGISRCGIGGLYFAKYLALSVGGCLAGTILAAAAGKQLGTHMRELYGDAGNMGVIYTVMILGAAAAEGLILLAVYLNIRRTDKMSAVEALCGADSRAKKNLWLPASIITAAAMFMILVPWNIRSTLNAPEFVTYMGIGESRIRIDIRQSESGQNIAAEIAEEIRRDNRVSRPETAQDGFRFPTDEYAGKPEHHR